MLLGNARLFLNFRAYFAIISGLALSRACNSNRKSTSLERLCEANLTFARDAVVRTNAGRQL